MHPNEWGHPPYIVYSSSFEELGRSFSGHRARFDTKDEALLSFASLTELGTIYHDEHITNGNNVIVFSATNPDDIKYIQDNYKP